MKTVATSVIVVSVNEVSDEEIENLKNSHGVESLDMVAQDMEDQLERIVVSRVFGDADSIPIVDVSTEVYENWDDDQANAMIQS